MCWEGNVRDEGLNEWRNEGKEGRRSSFGDLIQERKEREEGCDNEEE